MADESLGFPKPIRIRKGGPRLFRLSEVEEFERSRARRAPSASAALR
jgi:hypothetical protein